MTKDPGADGVYALSVSDVTREIKKLFRENFAPLWIEGELSGYKKHSSGHHYFTLKDSNAQLSCAMWKLYAGGLRFEPRDGLLVQAFGELEVYEPQGKYQLIVRDLRLSGEGALQRAFEELKQKLEREGLFDPKRKRKLPAFPQVIGLVTSPTGAALQDMKTVAARRWPLAKLLIKPARVQGKGAAEEIAQAIREFSNEMSADVLIIGRGGGSLEDLWAFNEEIVARAIFACAIPVVSAVGHEIDFTISDFVADVRAATPSAAMEIVLPDGAAIAHRLLQLERRLAKMTVDRVKMLRHELAALSSHWALRQPLHLVEIAGQTLDEFHSRLNDSSNSLVTDKASQLQRLAELLQAVSPERILQRGYAVVRGQSGLVLRSASTAKPGDLLSIQFADGNIAARTVPSNTPDLFDEQ